MKSRLVWNEYANIHPHKLPKFKTFNIDLSTIDLLLKKLADYVEGSNLYSEISNMHESTSEKRLYQAENLIYMAPTGVYSHNLKEWDDDEYHDCVNNNILNRIPELIGLDDERIDIFTHNFWDYRDGGYVKKHSHFGKDDFTILIYLNTCETGRTGFYFEDEGMNNRYPSIRVTPTKGLACCFSGDMQHDVETTLEPKKTLVIGIKVNLEYLDWVYDDPIVSDISSIEHYM